jgi:hypothetical protein
VGVVRGPQVVKTETIPDTVTKITEFQFLFENAIPHKTALKPNMPMFIMFRGNENTKGTTTPIEDPRSAENVDILELTNIPINTMMPEIIFSWNITCPMPLLTAGIISTFLASGTCAACIGIMLNMISKDITIQVEIINGAV